MSEQRARQALPEPDDAGHAEEAGFVMLGLAQMVTIFAIWMATWPAAFGIPKGSLLAVSLGGVFTLAGTGGFYLSFRTLSTA